MWFAVASMKLDAEVTTSLRRLAYLTCSASGGFGDVYCKHMQKNFQSFVIAAKFYGLGDEFGRGATKKNFSTVIAACIYANEAELYFCCIKMDWHHLSYFIASSTFQHCYGP